MSKVLDKTGAEIVEKCRVTEADFNYGDSSSNLPLGQYAAVAGTRRWLQRWRQVMSRRGAGRLGWLRVAAAVQKSSNDCSSASASRCGASRCRPLR